MIASQAIGSGDERKTLIVCGTHPERRSTIAEAFRGVENSVEILESVLDIQEVKVLGDHAFQWGTDRYSLRPRAGGETVRTTGNDADSPASVRRIVEDVSLDWHR